MEIILIADGKEIGRKVKKKGVLVYPVSSKDINYNVKSWWEGSKKGGKESDKEKILKSLVAQSGENICFFIHFLCWYCFCVVWCLPGMVRSDKILGVVLWFILEMTADSHSLQDFLQWWVWLEWLGKNWKCVWTFNMWEKRAFWLSFVFIDRLS